MTDCISNLGRILKDSPSDMRVRCLDALASLMRIEVACFGLCLK